MRSQRKSYGDFVFFFSLSFFFALNWAFCVAVDDNHVATERDKIRTTRLHGSLWFARSCLLLSLTRRAQSSKISKVRHATTMPTSSRTTTTAATTSDGNSKRSSNVAAVPLKRKRDDDDDGDATPEIGSMAYKRFMQQATLETMQLGHEKLRGQEKFDEMSRIAKMQGGVVSLRVVRGSVVVTVRLFCRRPRHPRCRCPC